MKILLPVDGSDYTKRMLGYIASHDELLGKDHDYVVFTSVPGIPPHAAGYLGRELVDTYYRDEAEKVLEPVRAFVAQQGWNARFVHGHGPAADTIAELVSTEKPDLVVMGTHGHSALGNVILGSVATGVLSRCKVPVLLIR